MHISFVVPRVYGLFHPECSVHYGGAEKQAYLLGRSLAIYPDISVSYCVGDYGQMETEELGNIRLFRLFRDRDSFIHKILGLYQGMRLSNADVYIFRAAHTGILLGLFIARYLLKKKVIYMVAHDMEADPPTLAHHTGRVTAWAMGWVYRLSDGLTFQTRYQQDTFIKNHKRTGTVIANLYEIAEKTTTPLWLEQKTDIVWVWRAEPWKRPEVFLELAKAFPNYPFRMIMTSVDGKESYYTSLRNTAKSLPNLSLLSTRDRTIVTESYAYAKIYILTSESEGFSNTMMEAMEMECAILSLTVDPDGIIERYGIGIACENRQEKLTESLARLLADDTYRDTCGRNARAYLTLHHSPENVAPQVYSLLYALCGTGENPSSVSDTH